MIFHSYARNCLCVVECWNLTFPSFLNHASDEIRRFMPEFHIYIERSPELAGELTRKEAGFIAEILTLAGLYAGKNVLVDGSLRDAAWYEKYYESLRKEFPNLRIAIIQVTAPRDTVFQRAAVSAWRLIEFRKKLHPFLSGCSFDLLGEGDNHWANCTTRAAGSRS